MKIKIDNSKETNNNIINNKIQKEKEQNEKEYQKLVEELNKANNLLDYFLVVGVPPDIFHQNWLYQSNLEELNTKYKKELEPKVISYFPPITKKTISFDESIINHCFPNGYNLIKSYEQPRPKLFSFILDNNYYNLNFPKKYLSCLVFYEKITQYKVLYDEYIKLSAELADQINENQINLDKNENIYNEFSLTSIPISSSSFIPASFNIENIWFCIFSFISELFFSFFEFGFDILYFIY